MLHATYVLPILRHSVEVDHELTRYLAEIGRRCELIVVDGSAEASFEAAHVAWSSVALHVPPDPSIHGLNGKVLSVLTGIALASRDRVVIADDDVRYDVGALERTIALLDDADLVRPQNYFAQLVWHARWDTARSLLNRVAGGVDFPGTLAVRRSTMERLGGYRADVLFENLELIRTVEVAGGRVVSPPDLYVSRLPPSTAHFRSQRVRQAYDEFARPWRLVVYLALLPLTGWALLRRRRAQLTIAAASAVLVAEAGRRRSGGAAVFPFTASLFAPLWIMERAVCSWLALGSWLRGGCVYTGVRLKTAATPRRKLRRTVSGRARREPSAIADTEWSAAHA